MIRHCEDLNLKLKLCRIIALSILEGFVLVPLLSLSKKKKHGQIKWVGWREFNDSFEKWVVENGKCPLIKWKTINKERDKSEKQ